MPPVASFQGDYILLLNGVRVEEIPNLKHGDTLEVVYADALKDI